MLHTAAEREDDRSEALKLLKDFYDDVFDGLYPDRYYRLKVQQSEFPVFDVSTLGTKIGCVYYDKGRPLSYAAPGINNTLRRFAVCLPPLGGKSTFVANCNKLGIKDEFGDKTNKKKKNSPTYHGLDVGGHGACQLTNSDTQEIYRFIASLGLAVKDVDDLYDYEIIRKHVEARDWDKANPLKANMLKANAVDNCLYLVHSQEDADALGAQLIGTGFPDDKLCTPEVAKKHPLRASFFRLTKKGWRAKGKLQGEFQYGDYSELPGRILGRLLPHIMWESDLRGERSYTDERTAYHRDRLKKAQLAMEDRIKFVDRHNANRFLLWKAVDLGITTGDQHVLSSALECIYPLQDKSIMLRTRTGPTFTAKILLDMHKNYRSKVEHFLTIARQSQESEGIRGCSIAAFAALFLYYMGSEFRSELISVMIVSGVFALGMKGADDVLKPLHEDIRRGACLPPWAEALAGEKDYTAMMYMTTLMGRYYDVTLADDGSVNNRTKFPGVHRASDDGESFTYHEHMRTMDKSLDYLEHAAFDAILEANTRDVYDFHADLLSVASAGSAASGKDELQHIESDARMNKRAWLNELTIEDILNVPNRDPKVVSQAVNKVELNKIRQLLPGPVWHWLGESLVLWKVEAAAYKQDHYISLEKADATRFNRFMDRKERDKLFGLKPTLDMDYADFNITHMITDMQKIYRTIKAAALRVSQPGNTWGDTDYAGFVAKVCDWLIAALEELHMRADGGDGEIHHLVRGLWSGWKSTQFINTKENSNYFRQADMALTNIFGYSPILKAEGQGDDMDGVLESVVDGLITVLYFQRAGHEMNPLKQLIGSYSNEYLRITSHSNRVFGNLSRSIGSFCSSDLQSPEIENGPETVSGTNMAINTMIRRGLDEGVGNCLRATAVRHFSEIKIYNPATYDYDLHWLDPEDANISGHDGGLNCANFGQLAPVYALDHSRDDSYLSDTSHGGIIQVGFDWSGSTHLPTTYRGIKTHGAPLGANNNGIKALKHVVSRYMQARGLDPSIAEEVERAATDAVWDGLRDSEDEHDVRIERKRAIAGYYKACRSLRSSKPAPEPELDSVEKLVVENTLRELLAPADGLRPRYSIAPHDVEDIITTGLRLALGPASFAPNAINMLKTASGEKLTLYEALSALDSHAAGQVLSALGRFPFPEVVEYIIKEGGHSVKDTGALVAAELNIVIDNVQLAVMAHVAQSGSADHMSYGDWYRLMRATNTHIMKVYREKYYEQYRL